LTVRYERGADILTPLLHLAGGLICARRLGPLEESGFQGYPHRHKAKEFHRS
jgi:hypothetical protein